MNGRTPSRSVRIAAACLLVALAAAGVVWVTKGRTAPAPPPAAPTEEAIRAEFEQAAHVLFTTPGSPLDRTLALTTRKAIEVAGSNVGRAIPLRFALVEALLREGKAREAVAEADSAFRILEGVPGALDREYRPHYMRGLALLRLAEVENCIARHNDECCVFPLRGGGVHVDKSPAQGAAASFLAALAIKPDDLRARWLLNVAHMALGTYPESVPHQLLVPERWPDADPAFPRFRDVAKACGFVRTNHAGGVVADDLDGDGLLDVVLSSTNPEVPLACFRNQGDGTFSERGAAARFGAQLGGLNLVSTDYDGDGDLDLLVLRGGWMYDEGQIRKSLLRNEGDGTFADVTHSAGLGDTKAPSQVGVWMDYDNDGDLDLFLGNESRADPTLREERPRADYPSNLFRNEGNGTFTDVARQAGVTNDRLCKGAAAGDYDNDGWIDLYVSNIGRNRLYHNNRDGTFTDVAEKLGVIEPNGRSFATWFFDVDNDGNLDIFVGAYDAHIDDVAAWQLSQPFRAMPPRLYRNKGDGTFEDVTRAFGLWRPLAPMGANFGDLDNDGWLDVYLATGTPAFDDLMPNVMLRNAGGTRFADVTVAGGFGNLQKGHGVAFADFDHDGDQDVFNDLGGFYQGDEFYNSLYENPGSRHRFVTLKLEGRRSNRLAYGARVEVTVRTSSGPRAIHRAVGSVSSFGGSPARQEIGLGDATGIESVEIWWPASGIRQTLKGLEPDGFYRIVEGAAEAERLHPKRFTLGGL
jgi:hypothetical protein